MAGILVVTNLFPPHHYGGYELWCRDAVARWAASGHDVTVLTSDAVVPGVAPGGDDDRGVVPVRRSLRLYWDDHVLGRPGLLGRQATERHNQAALRDAIGSAQPDVVSCWNMAAISLGLVTTVRRLGIPDAHVVCNEWPDFGRTLDRWTALARGSRAMAGALERLTGLPAGPSDLGGSGQWSFVTEAVRAKVRRATGWTFPGSILVPCGIDTVDFPLDRVVAAPGRPWTDRLLYVGRVDRDKGIETAIAALGRLDHATLDVVGRGDPAERARLGALAADLGVDDQVRFAEAARHELPAVYGAADALVFPSIWDEPFGLVPLEAMACGTPVVATRTGGAAEHLVDGENCVAFRPGDVDDLVRAVERLRADGGLRDRLRDRGRVTAKRFDGDRVAAELLEAHLAVVRR